MKKEKLKNKKDGKIIKQKACKKLKSQSAAVVTALIMSTAFLSALFVLPEIYISELSEKINIKLDAAFEAVEKEDFAGANEYGKEIYSALKKAEPKLKLFMDHRDVSEIMNYALEAAGIDKYGDADAYMSFISDFTGIRIMLDFLKNNNSFSLSGVL